MKKLLKKQSKNKGIGLRVLSLILLLAFGAAASAAPATPFSVRLCGDRISLNARQAPLSAVLREFAHAGVLVKMDPRLSATVTGTLDLEDVERALEKLLEPFGYVLLWEVIEGPVGPLPKLKEIQVFQKGDPYAAQPLPDVDENLALSAGPDGKGPLFVQDEILIGMKPGTRADEFQRLIDQIGGSLIGSIPELGIYQVRLARGSNVLALIEQLKRNALVAEVEPNYAAQLPPPAGEASGDSLAFRTPAPPDGAPAAAILDSGLLASAGLGTSVVGTYDALNPARSLQDAVGHGTQMAMITSGAVQPSSAGAGANEAGVPIVAIRAFDDNGNASYFGLMRGINYALSQGARVANLSWGSETDSAFLSSAIHYAQSKGLIVVAAAGNTPTGKPVYPAAYKGVVAVGALGADGKPWAQSNYGSFVSLTAPGQATFPVGNKGPAGAYAGTSISSAYVTRALSLYLAQHPKATRDQALKALRDSLSATTTPNHGVGTLDSAAMGRLLKTAE